MLALHLSLPVLHACHSFLVSHFNEFVPHFLKTGFELFLRPSQWKIFSGCLLSD
uniref:Uncharacterized protein n=1 Tax=Mus musculus TaxID=10090 RepID=Q3TZV7_MOUSE|nr:unnamed protein product [Mus musculus]